MKPDKDNPEISNLQIRRSDREEFEIEYSNNFNNIPFIEALEKYPASKEHLFKDFCNSTPAPSIRLFLRKIFSDEEYESGIQDEHNSVSRYEVVNYDDRLPSVFANKLDEKINEYRNLLKTGKLEQKYFLPDILNTNTITAFKEIQSILTEIQHLPFASDPINAYHKICAQDILSNLDSLQCPEIKTGVLEIIINDDYDTVAYFYKKEMEKDSSIKAPDVHSAMQRWKRIKREVNHLLNSQLSNPPDITVDAQNPPNKAVVKKGLKKEFSEFLLSRNKEAIMNELHRHLDNYQTGRTIAMILEAAIDCGLIRNDARIVNPAIREFKLNTSNQSISNYLNKDRFNCQEKKRYIDLLSYLSK